MFFHCYLKSYILEWFHYIHKKTKKIMKDHVTLNTGVMTPGKSVLFVIMRTHYILKGSYDAISSFPFSLECYKQFVHI